jgi:hypothetical protein
LINVSESFRKKISEGDPVIEEVDITFSDGTVKTVNKEILNSGNDIVDGVDGSSFPVGQTVCKSCQLALDNSQDQWKNYYFYGAKLRVKLKMELDNGTVETIDRGTFTVTTPEEYGEDVELTALDDMYKANKTYTTSLAFPQDAYVVLEDACESCGISLGVSSGSMEYSSFQIQSIPDSVTFRDVIGYIAILESANARIDNNDYLQFTKWDFSNNDNNLYELKDYVSSPTLSADDIVITGVQVKNGNDSALYGKAGYVLEFENDLLQPEQLKTVSEMIGSNLVGTSFRSMEGETLYNPLLEFSDVTKTYDRNGNVYVTPLTYVASALNGKTTVKTQADSPIRGSSNYSSDSSKTLIQAKRLVNEERSAREEAIKKLQESATDSSGLYETPVLQEDGSTITYLHDKPTLAESKIVIKITSEAIAVSNDGGKTYPYGFILTGEMITDKLYAAGINADYINAGKLLGKFLDAKNLRVSTKDGQVTLYINENGQVFINPSTFFLSDDKTIDTAIAEKASEEVKKMTSLNVVLSNEYQGIPTDADGNYTTFPACSTTLQTLFGTEDVTADAEYAVTEQDITGTWDAEKHTYTATGISADVGYAEFTVTYKDFSIKKQFTIAKQKQGTSGADAVTYYIDSDATVVVRSADGTYTPKTILFKNYEKTGRNAKLYNSSILIQTTTDGTTFTTYTSTVLTSGQYTLLLSNISSDVTAIRYTFKDNSLPPKTLAILTIPIINDTELTEQQIFNLLTDNGARDILTYVDGKLFLNGTYIKGKTIAADKLNVTDLASFGAKIGGWTINNANLQSVGSKVKLIASGKIQIGNVILASDGDACTVKYGLHIYAGTDTISDGTDKFKVFNLNHVTSGGHLVFASDGATVSYLSSSSKRYKNHVANMTTDEAKKVLEIPIVWFKYKDGYLDPSDWLNGKEIPGFYAEDAYKAFPEAAQLNENGQPEDWNYRTIIPAMLKVMQDQQETIDNLVKRVEKLEKEI